MSSGDQRQKKNERFNGTLQAEVLRFEHFAGLEACRGRFRDWRRICNCERPHEGIAMEVPAGRYQVSDRTYPEELPPMEYGPGDEVRQVNLTRISHDEIGIGRVGLL